jgi:hypothetical protein
MTARFRGGDEMKNQISFTIRVEITPRELAKLGTAARRRAPAVDQPAIATGRP